MTQCQVEKVRFVERLSQGVQGGISNVDSITYEVYGSLEFVRVNYVGGGYTVRNCSGNSHSAIFREVGKLLDKVIMKLKGIKLKMTSQDIPQES